MQASNAQDGLPKMGNTFSTRSGNNSRPTGRETEPRQLEPIHKGFIPTRQDIQIAAHVLMGLQLQAPPGHLPSELALSILAHADYGPRITTSKAGRMPYIPRGGRPWYLTTRMLPPDFGRATSLTLQVRSEDRGINQERLFPQVGYDGSYIFPGDSDESSDEEPRRCSTWFQLFILRPLDRSPPSPPIDGYVLDGCVERPVSSTCDEDAEFSDFRDGTEFLQVRYNGRVTWEIYHHNMQVISDDPSAGLNREGLDGTPRVCRTYRIDCPAPESQDPEAFVDGEGFLSALMPGDMIVLSAGAKDPSSGMMVKEAVLEIVYDYSI